jgi:NCAIR mutase (PurE)-related protein
VSDVTLDFARRRRIGFDEAILCAGKSRDQLCRILDAAAGRSASLLLTRLDEAARRALGPGYAIDYEALSRTGFFGPVAAPSGEARVAIVAAGTSDAPVSREAARSLSYYGVPCMEFGDLGVAGLWRLEERLDAIRVHPVVIVVAGMDAALASVLGGLVPGAVIVVPTSTGYGAARGGETALMAALASCAPGLSVVNIDNGYGAACAALRILRPDR